jgi:hypothetical protein
VPPAGFEPPATPAGYRLNLFTPGQPQVEGARALTEIFHAARLPQPIASQLWDEIAGMYQRDLDDRQLELMNARTMAQLTNEWGDQTQAKVDTARAFLKSLEGYRPGLLKLLEKSGAGSSPVVIRQLVAHAERINEARKR